MELWKYQFSFLKWRQSPGSYSLGSLVTTLAHEDPVQCRSVIIRNTLNVTSSLTLPRLVNPIKHSAAPLNPCCGMAPSSGLPS